MSFCIMQPGQEHYVYETKGGKKNVGGFRQ